MKNILFSLQDLDEKRIKNIKNFMLSSVDVERKVFPIIMQCLDGMEQAAKSINEKEVNFLQFLLTYYDDFNLIILCIIVMYYLYLVYHELWSALTGR